MDFELFKKVVDEIAAFGKVTILCLTFGGEGLLHPRFAEMLEYAASKNKFKIFFYTNGTLFDSRIVAVFCKLKIWRVVFSLDGLEGVHEACRRGSNYDTVMNNIKSFVDRRGGEKLPQIYVNMTLYKQTREEVRDFVNYWVQYADGVEICPAIGEDMNYVTPDFFDESTREAINYCPWPFHYLGVYWNGDITTCCIDLMGINVIGNLATQTLSEIWNGKKYRKFRHQILKNAPRAGPLCNGCNFWKYWFTHRTVKQDGLKVTYEMDAKFYERSV
jgi:radical SAM protein with 4Fe4S-binding SPASM domain